MLGYQVDEFTHTWLMKHLLGQSEIYPKFTGKTSTLTNIQLEMGCEDYSFIDQAVRDFDQSIDFVLMDASFD